MVRLRAVVCVAIACGSSQRGTAPAPPLEVKTYAPLGIKADAKLANQAVILGTDASDRSTIVPLPVAPGTALVDATFVKLAPVTAGMSPVRLGTAPNHDPAVSGTATQWHAGVWLAAIVAATTLDKDLTDFTVSASGAGDGPSASGLLAGGFLAAMTGAAVDPKVTMIGMINPDGTIGPVAGIPEQLGAAIDKGKKRIGYPLGMRYAKSAKTAKPVDLVALAKQHGVEAVEIADIDQAYKLLTGKQLPEPVPVAAADMALDAATSKVIDAKYKQWQQRLAIEWAAILTLESAGRLPAVLAGLRDDAKSSAEAAEHLHKTGKLGAAYARMVAASVYARSANQIYDVLAKVQANQLADAAAALDKLETPDETAVFLKIGALAPSTLGGHLQMLAAFRAALRGWMFAGFASEMLASTKTYIAALAGKTAAELGSEAIADGLVARLAPAMVYLAKTAAETTLATEQLELETAPEVNYTTSVPAVHRLATTFQSAGAAAVDYLEALPDRQRITSLDQLIASKLERGLPKQLEDTWGETSLAWGLLSLARGELAYWHAAALIAKYDSLEVATNDAGQIMRVGQERALVTLLATAERNARANARAARIATGAIPVQAKLAYDLARAEHEGSLAEQLDALAQFWAASAFSQTAVMLARN